MASAKGVFISHIRSLKKSIGIESVTTKALNEEEHNEVARMLRNGLAVVSFAALEDFIKKRSSELLQNVSSSGVPFSSLPEKLQNAATFEAVSALSYQMSIRNRDERAVYIQEQAQKIASTATTNYEITEHAFAYSQANVSDDVIASILRYFNISSPWQQMTALSSRLQLTALPLVESYKNAVRRRHRAAHVAVADTPQGDIEQFVKEAFAIAIGFDALLTKAVSKINSYDPSYLVENKKLDASDIKFRKIQYVNSHWKEFVEGRSRAHRVNADLSILKPEALHRSSEAQEVYVEWDCDGQISDWKCH